MLQVIAFAMKEFGWDLEQTIEEVRSKRQVIRPNDAFMQQLQTYEGILNARYLIVFFINTPPKKIDYSLTRST